jgi:hypothetical protein
MSTDAQKSGSKAKKKQARKEIPLLLSQLVAANESGKPVSVAEIAKARGFESVESMVRWTVARDNSPVTDNENPKVRKVTRVILNMFKKKFQAEHPDWFESATSDGAAVLDSAIEKAGLDLDADTADGELDLGIELAD